MKYLLLAIIILLAASCTFADDIVTMPTANQLKGGEIDAAAYYLSLDFPDGAPQFVQYQALCFGLSDRLEVDIHRSAIDKNETATVFVSSFKVFSEARIMPDLVVGCRNLFGTATTYDNPFTPIDERGLSKDRSYFVAAAKTFFFSKPGPPLVRVHVGAGTADWTLLGEERHKGIFGGLQFLLRPDLGLVVENDGQDTITGITIMPKNTGITIKGGTYGDHTWVGIAFRGQLPN